MIEWIAYEIHRGAWVVLDRSDGGGSGRVIVTCGHDEALARRIAELPELEAIVADLLAACKRAENWLAFDVDGREQCGPLVDALRIVRDAIAEAEREEGDAMSRTHFRDAPRTARKAHKCWLCGRRIETGDKYAERVGANGGVIMTMRMHAACKRETADWRLDDWECTSEGDLRQYMEEKEAAAAAEQALYDAAESAGGGD